MVRDRSTTPNAPRDRIRRVGHVRSTWCGGDLVLFDTRRDTYYTLNRVAGRIWDLLATPRTTSELVRALRAEYDVPPSVRAAVIERDVSALVRDLSMAGLLVPAAPNVTGEDAAPIPAAG